ncbi:MAG: MoaD/ThiS family protein [Aquisalimonadaceae bacterium]
MPEVRFTPNLERHVKSAPRAVAGGTVRAALEQVFELQPILRGYILDDQGKLRRHVMVFVDNNPVRDAESLSDPVSATSRIFVMQALSGG